MPWAFETSEKQVQCTFLFFPKTTERVMTTPMPERMPSDEDEELTVIITRCLQRVYSSAFAEPAPARLHLRYTPRKRHHGLGVGHHIGANHGQRCLSTSAKFNFITSLRNPISIKGFL